MKFFLAQLLALNLAVAVKIEHEPVTAPGVPKNYPPTDLRVANLREPGTLPAVPGYPEE